MEQLRVFLDVDTGTDDAGALPGAPLRREIWSAIRAWLRDGR
jgi:hypothetical protein